MKLGEIQNGIHTASNEPNSTANETNHTKSKGKVRTN